MCAELCKKLPAVNLNSEGAQKREIGLVSHVPPLPPNMAKINGNNFYVHTVHFD